MDIEILEQLLKYVRLGSLPVGEALERLRVLPFENLGFTRVDHHRQLRQGFPEVVYAAGKSVSQIRGILTTLQSTTASILVTRLAPEKAQALLPEFPAGFNHPDSQVLTITREEIPDRGRGEIGSSPRTPPTSRWPKRRSSPPKSWATGWSPSMTLGWQDSTGCWPTRISWPGPPVSLWSRAWTGLSPAWWEDW